MQEPPKNNRKEPEQERELDLGVFFNLIGNLIRKTLRGIRYFFVILSNLVLGALLFIKRKIIWLALGGLAGFGFGLQRYLSKGPAYYSDMYVRANFESSRLLYNQIDYYNALIKENRVVDLSKDFTLSIPDVEKLIQFDISPVNNELEAAKLYKNTFLTRVRTTESSLVDTQWAKTMKFTEFKESLQPIDFPLQKIRLYSSSPDVYSKVEQAIVTAINSNKDLQATKQKMLKIYEREENIINRSLAGLDSLRFAYNKNLTEMASVAKTSGTGIVVTDKNLRSPEIDLYDKELLLKDELAKIQKRAVDQQDILQINASFSPVGVKRSGVNQDFFKYTWWGILITFGILLFIMLYKYLDAIDQNKRKPKKNSYI